MNCPLGGRGIFPAVMDAAVTGLRISLKGGDARTEELSVWWWCGEN
jgi:hypothetical protein